MTTLISWVGVDQRAPASLYIAADSRITWGSEHWDRGAKTFASPTTPDVLGYCGDVLFPALVLPQFIACLGADLFGSTWKHRRRALSQLVERSIAQMPRTQRRKFTIVYCSREGKGMQSRFRAGARVPPTTRVCLARLANAQALSPHLRRGVWSTPRRPPPETLG